MESCWVLEDVGLLNQTKNERLNAREKENGTSQREQAWERDERFWSLGGFSGTYERSGELVLLFFV